MLSWLDKINCIRALSYVNILRSETYGERYLHREEYQNGGRWWREFHQLSTLDFSVSIATCYSPNCERHRSARRRDLPSQAKVVVYCPANRAALHCVKRNELNSNNVKPEWFNCFVWHEIFLRCGLLKSKVKLSISYFSFKSQV